MFSSNGKLILLHKGLKELPKASRYDFVLSPQFYILKREELPVKYAFEAKKLAPSILEDILPTNDTYEYIVKKEGNSWLFFAYSPKEIEEFLLQCCSSVSPSKIGKIYFADQLKEVLKKVPLGIDEKNALTLIDNKATIVSRSMLESEKYAKFTSKLRPKTGFKFKQLSKSAANNKITKGSIAVSALMLLLSAAYIAEGYSYKIALKQKEDKINNLLNDYPSLQGKMIRESIKSKYEKIEKHQRSIRELLDKFSQLTSKKSLLNKLELNNNKMTVEFNVEPKEIDKIIKIAKKAQLKATKSGNNKVRIEGVLK